MEERNSKLIYNLDTAIVVKKHMKAAKTTVESVEYDCTVQNELVIFFSLTTEC